MRTRWEREPAGAWQEHFRLVLDESFCSSPNAQQVFVLFGEQIPEPFLHLFQPASPKFGILCDFLHLVLHSILSAGPLLKFFFKYLIWLGQKSLSSRLPSSSKTKASLCLSASTISLKSSAFFKILLSVSRLVFFSSCCAASLFSLSRRFLAACLSLSFLSTFSLCAVDSFPLLSFCLVAIISFLLVSPSSTSMVATAADS